MDKRWYARAAVAILVALIITACAPAPVPTPVPPKPAATEAPKAAAPTQAPAPTAAPAAQKPTVIRVPLASDPKSLEPGLVLELVSGWVAENLHAGLVRYNQQDQVSPYLAEKFEVSADGLTYTFTLRKDAKWQNGRQVVASDFKKGWERYLDPQVAAQAGPDYLGAIKGAKDIIDGKTKDLAGAEVVSDQVLKVTVEKPDPNFILRLASSSTWVVPSEAVVEGKPEWKGDPVGGGPFKFVEWKRNERIVLEAWDGFFGGKPTVDRIEYYVVPDNATALAQYEAGELDLVQVTGANLKRAQDDAKLSKELQTWPGAQLTYFGLNPKVLPQFADKRVRQAVNYALNRAEIVQKVLFNANKPAAGIVPTGIPEYNPNQKGYEYNVDKAKKLLADAGFPDGKGFPSFGVNTTSAYATIAEAFAAQMKQNLGLNVQVNTLERGEMVKGLWDRGKYQAFFWGWTADFPSAEIWTHQLLHSGLDSNFFNYNNPDFDKIVDQARSTLDEAKRIALWQQAEQIALDDAAMVPFAYSQYNYLVKPYVKGIFFRPDGPYWYKDVVVSR